MTDLSKEQVTALRQRYQTPDHMFVQLEAIA